MHAAGGETRARRDRPTSTFLAKRDYGFLAPQQSQELPNYRSNIRLCELDYFRINTTHHQCNLRNTPHFFFYGVFSKKKTQIQQYVVIMITCEPDQCKSRHSIFAFFFVTLRRHVSVYNFADSFSFYRLIANRFTTVKIVLLYTNSK